MDEKEMVSHPSHYNKNGIECFDVIKAFFGMDGGLLSFQRTEVHHALQGKGEVSGRHQEGKILS